MERSLQGFLICNQVLKNSSKARFHKTLQEMKSKINFRNVILLLLKYPWSLILMSKLMWKRVWFRKTEIIISKIWIHCTNPGSQQETKTNQIQSKRRSFQNKLPARIKCWQRRSFKLRVVFWKEFQTHKESKIYKWYQEPNVPCNCLNIRKEIRIRARTTLWKKGQESFLRHSRMSCSHQKDLR